jgi:predicted  nucleic acid-binding Zn-ribbon protein
MEERLARIEGAFEQMGKRLNHVETEIEGLRGEIRDLRGEIRDLRGELGGEIRDLRSEIRSLYRMMIVILIPMWVTIMGTMIGLALAG